jgi:nucleotide-binding universal stress UspA family protein
VTAYKTLLVSLNEIERSDVLLDAALALARTHGAHLLGLYVIPAPTVYPAVGPYVVPEVFDGLTRFFEEQSRQMRSKFEASVSRGGLSGQWLELRALGPTLAESVSELGRTADLLLVSDVNREGRAGVEFEFLENVILGAGRPVMILPRSGEIRLEGGLIVCGYNGSKEAARAIDGALPLLSRSREAVLLWVDPPEGAGGASGSAGLMVDGLRRHDVQARFEGMESKGANPADAVLSEARGRGADIVVMGAYGHSRIREFVLGGATRHALSTIAIPLLMSH